MTCFIQVCFKPHSSIQIIIKKQLQRSAPHADGGADGERGGAAPQVQRIGWAGLNGQLGGGMRRVGQLGGPKPNQIACPVQ